MRWLCFLVAVSITIQSTAQTLQPALLFMEGIGGDRQERVLPRVVTTDDGGFIVTITSSSLPSTGNITSPCINTPPYSGKDITIFRKYNATGDTVKWEKCMSNTSDSFYRHIIPMKDGNYILGGNTWSIPLGQDILIRKEDIQGNILWRKRYGGSAGDVIADMIATDDGGFILLGNSLSNDGDVGFNFNPPLNSDIWVFRIDSVGNKLWSTVLGGSQDEGAVCIVPIKNGGCYITGYTASSDYDCTTNHGGLDLFVAHLDDTGGKVWTKCFGGNNYDAEQDIWAVNDANNGLLIGTNTNSYNGDVSNHIGGNDYWLLKIDSSSNILWDKCYGSVSHENINSLCIANDNTVWMTGGINKKGGDIDIDYGKGDAWILHVDSAGNYINSKVLGTTETDFGTMIYPLSNGNIFTGGIYEQSGSTTSAGLPTSWYGLNDVYIARFLPWSTGVKDISNTFPMEVYPNPADKQLHLSPKQKDINYSVRLVNTEGRIVYQKNKLKGEYSISLSGMDAGIYQLHITTHNNQNFATTISIH